MREAGCEKIFVENASRARKDRLQLKATLKYFRDGDTLVVWKLSRLARSLKQVIQTVQTMHTRNIEFRVLTQKIDTTTPDGRLFFHITASFDQFQRELISENIRAGLLAARKHGQKGGQPRAMDDDKVRLAETLLRDKKNYPFINDVIKELQLGRTAFYRYFPPEKIRELRSTHSETD